MAKLKLEETPIRTLEIERPDGKVIKLNLKRILKKDSSGIEKLTKQYQLEYDSGKIDANAFYDKQIALVTENYNSADFDNIEVNHLALIAEKLTELSQAKGEEEKKSQE